MGPKTLKGLWLAVFLVSAPGLPPKTIAESNSTSEYDVKAAFLFHFAQFVEWAPGAFEDVDSPLMYCTIGEDAFRGALDRSVKGKRSGTASCGRGTSKNGSRSKVAKCSLSGRLRERGKRNSWPDHRILSGGEKGALRNQPGCGGTSAAEDQRQAVVASQDSAG